MPSRRSVSLATQLSWPSVSSPGDGEEAGAGTTLRMINKEMEERNILLLKCWISIITYPELEKQVPYFLE